MNIKDFFEITFVIVAGMAMPFIVIGSYFTSVPKEERTKPLAVFFLVISLIYAVIFTYFA